MHLWSHCTRHSGLPPQVSVPPPNPQHTGKEILRRPPADRSRQGGRAASPAFLPPGPEVGPILIFPAPCADPPPERASSGASTGGAAATPKQCVPGQQTETLSQKKTNKKKNKKTTKTKKTEERVDMETSAPRKKPWWTVPENFHAPMTFYLEEGQEELIFGQSDTYLRCIEVHSYTLIQLESWFTPTGQTRVTVVGPYSARQWLFHMISRVISQDSYRHAQGLKMLEHVRSQPLSEHDLETPMSMESNTGDLSLASRMSGTISLSVPEASPYRLAGCSGFHLSSLYWR
ncbi:KH homology domain-containing protein 1-like [Microcebus murinus]|uniref:KH homology domain-containing protein 1-like n=1 Tax=Microcebus murinus TaxID=30608 RepID=UPI003F6B4890